MDNGTVRLILQDDVLTAVLSGEIDHHTAQGMREEIDFTVNQSKPKKLILSFEHVGFMDSAGIGLIIGRYKLMESLGGELVVSHLSPKMEQIVSLSGVGKLAKTIYLMSKSINLSFKKKIKFSTFILFSIVLKKRPKISPLP